MRSTRLWAMLVVSAAAAALVRAQVPTAPPIPKGPNVVLGRVLEMGTDSPISGAMVTLFGDIVDTGRVQPVASKNVMTAADGHFVFRELPAGRYTIAVRALGYLGSEFPRKVIEVHDNDRPTPIPVRLWRHAAIGGRVIDERGEPVVGMAVNALQRVASGGSVRMTSAATAMTDDRGVYRLAELAPGQYVVGVLSTTTTLPAGVAGALEPSIDNRDAYSEMMSDLIQSGFGRTWGCPTCFASSSDGDRRGAFVLQRLGPTLPPAPGGQPLGFANAFHPGTSNPNDAAVITLGSGESRAGVDVALRFAPGVSISGVVSGPDGPPRHLVLRLVPPGIDLSSFDPPGIATAVTDARGGFMFLGVAPGEYTLSAARTEGNFTTGEGTSLWSVQQLTLADADINGLNITMQSGVRMNGRVEFKGLSGNPPTQRQVVTLRPVRATFWRSFQAVVQPDGTFRSVGEPPGRYIVNASAPTGWFWQSTTLAGKPVRDEIIELESAELSGLVLTFGQTTNRVTGSVTDQGGAPDGDAAVIMFPTDSTAWREGIFPSRRVRYVYATSKAGYEIATLAPGDYYIAAVGARVTLDWQGPGFLERLVPGATRITLGAEDSKVVPLKTVTLSAR